MKIWLYLATALGFALTVAIVVYNNADLVLSTLLSQGPGMLAVIASHAVPLAFSAGGWWLVAKHEWPQGRFSDFLQARVLREAVNDLLPVAQVGGPLAGARLLTLHGAPGRLMGASLFVDVTAEVASQLIFVLLGIVLLALDGRAPTAVNAALVGSGLLTLGVIGFVLAQKAGLVRFIDRLVRDLSAKLGRDIAGDPQELHDAVWRSYGRKGHFGTSFVLHVLCWVLGALEVWLALYFLGHPVSVAEAIILESLSQAIRSAAFLIPAGLGVQEGGFIVLGAAFGISAPVSLALSLTKRVREVIFGGVSLIAWQLIEGRRFAANLKSSAQTAGK